jgi:hypothetical protein
LELLTRRRRRARIDDLAYRPRPQAKALSPRDVERAGDVLGSQLAHVPEKQQAPIPIPEGRYSTAELNTLVE